jgi:hypothetical protein
MLNCFSAESIEGLNGGNESLLNSEKNHTYLGYTSREIQTHVSDYTQPCVHYTLNWLADAMQQCTLVWCWL